MAHDDKPFGAGVDTNKILSDNSIRRQRRSVGPTRVAGVSGTAVYGGFVDDFERDAELVGRRRFETFSNMIANVSIVSAGMRFFLNLLSNPDWRAVPNPDTVPTGQEARAEELAKLTTMIMHDMDTPWNRVVRRTGMFRYHGFSIQEKIARRTQNGVIGLRDIAPRPQITIEKWDTEEDGTVHGAVQRAPESQRELYIPRDKMVYAVDDAMSDSPTGLGLLRHCAEPARVLKRYEQLEGWGFETDLRGTPVGRAPLQALQDAVESGEMSAEERDQKISAMKTFIENHIRSPKLGLLLDSMAYESADEAQRPSSVRQWDLELVKSGGQSHAEIAAAIERKIREMARVLGVEHLLLGDNGVGSFAMARDKSHNFALIVDNTLKDLIAIYFKDVVTWIFALNGWPMELRPKLVTDKLKFRNVDEITGALLDMSRAGATLHEDDPAILETRRLLGLSEPTTILTPQERAELERPQVPEQDEESVRDQNLRQDDQRENQGGRDGSGRSQARGRQ